MRCLEWCDMAGSKKRTNWYIKTGKLNVRPKAMQILIRNSRPPVGDV